MKAKYLTGIDVLEDTRDSVMSGEAPRRIPAGTGRMTEIQLVCGQVTIIGGAPGSGKTGLVMQGAVDGLRIKPDIKALVCNVEMTPKVLMERQLARLSGVSLTTIRDRKLTEEHAERIDQGLATLEDIAPRICFIEPPFSLENVAHTYDEFGADLIILDYVQRIQPEGKHDQDRQRVNACMDTLRRFASAGAAVVAVSAVGRTKDSKGRSSYSGSGMSLASFRESSELEFGADDAYILHPDGDDAEGDEMLLRHLKSRHAECRDLLLDFDRPRQRFTPVETTQLTTDQRAATRAELVHAWGPAIDE